MTKTIILCTLSWLISISLYGQQKSIVIDDDLAANSKAMKVKMGTQWMGKIWNFRFGDYAVVSSKNGWQTTNSKTNFFNTKTQSISKKKFSFVLGQEQKASATVNAARELKTEELNAFQVIPGLFVGRSEFTEGSDLFTAFITISSDTSALWSLLMLEAGGTRTPGQYRAILTDGQREIFIVPVNSNLYGDDKRATPALGYELRESGQALSAMQYYGGGTFGMNKNIMWIDQRSDQSLQLVLAAAMTAILQIRVDSMLE